MTSIGNIDQRERKKQQGQVAAFYSSQIRRQMSRGRVEGLQMAACGALG